MGNKKKYKYLILLTFLLIYGYVILPKGAVQGLFMLLTCYFCLFVYKKHIIIKHLMMPLKISRQVYSCFVVFFAIACFYLVISIFNLPALWGVPKLNWDFTYIPRHFNIILELFLAIGLGYCMYKRKFLFKIKNKYLILILLITYPLRYFFAESGVLPYSSILVAAILLISARKRYFFLPPLIVLANTGQAAYVLGSVVCLFLYYLERPVFYIFKYKPKYKLLVIIVSCIALFILAFPIIYEIAIIDANSFWRLQVWQNETESLLHTYGTGVGFGSAYVTKDFTDIVINNHMYWDDSDSQNIYSQLFKVANHNSFLNMFYRMGIIGGLLFILLYIGVISWAVRSYRFANKRNKTYLWVTLCTFMYQTVVILLNPGLEMMQFAFSFLLSLAMLLSILFTNNFTILKALSKKVPQNEK